jgi:predicted RNase H-like nuclease
MVQRVGRTENQTRWFRPVSAQEVYLIWRRVEVIDLPSWLRNRPPKLACLAIDIPIGLLDGSRVCDKEARRLLGQPRGTSVFAAPCRAALLASSHSAASAVNRQTTGRGLTIQAWCIAGKIKQVDDVITPEPQRRQRSSKKFFDQ